MTRVVPSQVVALIDQLFPAAQNTPDFPVYSASAGALSAIVILAKEIPGELLSISGQDYSDLIHGMESLSQRVQKWNLRGGDEPPPRIRGKSPIVVIRDALAKCPDQRPSPQTTELPFICDDTLRDSIRLDISSANEGLHTGQWKASTVLAGAALEALLLWATQRDPAALSKLSEKPGGAPERWGLEQYIDVADRLGIVKESTVKQAKLAQGFRNLIHPGRAQRTAEVCDRGTALTALAAVELVVRDLSARR
jgi:hypothetical protein